MYAPVDEDFPSKRQLLGALAVAFVTAAVGFSLSYGWLIAHRPFGLPRPVDRKAAEASQEHPGEGGRGPTFSAPASRLGMRGSSYTPKKPAPRELPENIEKLKEALAVAPRATPGAPAMPRTATPSPMPASLYPEGREPGKKRSTRRTRKRETRSQSEATTVGGRTFPPAGNRAPAGSLSDAWIRAQSGVALLTSAADEPVACGLITGDGYLITRATPGVMGGGLRVRANGSPEPVLEILGYVSRYELVVMRVPAAGNAPPLAPEAPARGEELALAPGFGAPSQFQSALVLEETPSIGEGCFRFQGACYPTNAGSPLVNSRGEVIGLVLGKPWAYPGNNFCIGVDSAVLWSVVQQAREGRLEPAPGPESFSQSVRAYILATLGPPPPTGGSGRSNARIEPARSLGNYPIGMSREDLEREFGAGSAPSFPGGFRTVQVQPYPLQFTMLDDRVVAISTTDRFYATSKGVGVGASADTLRRDPAFSNRVDGYAPGGRRQVVARGVEVTLGGDEAERVTVVSEPLGAQP